MPTFSDNVKAYYDRNPLPISSPDDYDKGAYINQRLAEDIEKAKRELNQEPGTTSNALATAYNDTMMVGVLWASLGTVLLFYTFRQL